jgi:hypothetical protein
MGYDSEVFVGLDVAKTRHAVATPRLADWARSGSWGRSAQTRHRSVDWSVDLRGGTASYISAMRPARRGMAYIVS